MPKTELPWRSQPPPDVAKRPKCKGCGMALKPSWYYVWERGHAVGKRFEGQYDSYDGFHSLRCALSFARAAYAAGYRMVSLG